MRPPLWGSASTSSYLSWGSQEREFLPRKLMFALNDGWAANKKALQINADGSFLENSSSRSNSFSAKRANIMKCQGLNGKQTAFHLGEAVPLSPFLLTHSNPLGIPTASVGESPKQSARRWAKNPRPSNAPIEDEYSEIASQDKLGNSFRNRISTSAAIICCLVSDMRHLG